MSIQQVNGLDFFPTASTFKNNRMGPTSLFYDYDVDASDFICIMYRDFNFLSRSKISQPTGLTIISFFFTQILSLSLL